MKVKSQVMEKKLQVKHMFQNVDNTSLKDKQLMEDKTQMVDNSQIE